MGSLFGLAPDGVFHAVLFSQNAVVSYTTFSPLPKVAVRISPGGKPLAVYSLWHYPSKRFKTFLPRVSTVAAVCNRKTLG